jgi:hypothetical protein
MGAVIRSNELPLRLLTQGTDERMFAKHSHWILQRHEYGWVHIHELSDRIHRHSECTVVLSG